MDFDDTFCDMAAELDELEAQGYEESQVSFASIHIL